MIALKVILGGAARRNRKILITGLFALVACTDYVDQIDERIAEYDTYEKARIESQIRTAEYYVDPSKVFFGELEDPRDEKIYATVTIGSQTWMAENLNYDAPDSYCYNDADSNCAMYGRLYTWATAMDSAGTIEQHGLGCGLGKFCAPTYPVRGVCPKGWHLPSFGEWETLMYAVDDVYSEYGNTYDGRPILQKIGWDNDNQDEEDYGFRICPSGLRMGNGKYYYEGSRAYFWTSAESDREMSYTFTLNQQSSGSIIETNRKDYGVSVRCVKNETDEKPTGSSSSKKTSSSSSEKFGDDEQSSNSIDPKSSSSSVDARETFIDERDGKVYKATVIGAKRWMAENLNFETERSSCYNDSAANCDMYGRLYPWADAVDSAGVYSKSAVGCGYGVECSPPSHVRGICPENWHLPSQEEWDTLFGLAGNRAERLESFTKFGFGVLSAGYRMSDTTFYHLGSRARFWISEESTPKLAYFVGFDGGDMGISSVDKYYGFSIRCVQDDEVSGLISSSSVGISSSSRAPWAYLNSKISYGEMTDARDEQVYKTVEIGSQTWMAENLNIGVEVPDWRELNDDSQIEHYCFDNKVDNCELYGGLYTWAEAMDLPNSCNTENCTDLFQSRHRGICPEDWHLPTSEEFEALIEYVGGKEIAGRMLKSKKGWAEIGSGWDDFGFSALPNGENSNNDCSGGSGLGGCSASYWSTTISQENNESEHPEYWGAYGMSLSANSDKASLFRNILNAGYETASAAVRCIRDDSTLPVRSSSSAENSSSIGTSSSGDYSSSSGESSSSENSSSSSNSSSSGNGE